MKTLYFTDKEAWLEGRRGKITGSKLKNIVVKRGTGKKIGYYQLIADRLALPDDGEMTPMDRGTACEPNAIDEFEKVTGKVVDRSLVIWTRDDDESIAYSPDGFIGETEAVECKCLSSARHIEALVTQTVPDEHWYQVLQAFIVNEKLETLYVCFYDDRLLTKQFFYITVTRSEIQAQIDWHMEYERKVLEEVNEIVNQLMDF